MNNSLLVPILIALLVLLIIFIALRPRRAHHRRHMKTMRHPEDKMQKMRNPPKRVLNVPFRHQDHGAYVAHQHGHERSPLWPRVAQEHLLLQPACVVCGHKGRHLQVHHIKPFHLHPDLELDPHNLITLCEARGREHHLLLGHLDSWHSYNVHIHEDAKHYYSKNAAQIRLDKRWQEMMLRRP